MKEKKTFVKCDHCGIDVRDINLGDHNLRVHGIVDSVQNKTHAKKVATTSKMNDPDNLYPITNKTFHDFIQIRLKERKPASESEARKIVDQACDDYNKLAKSLLTGVPTTGAIGRFLVNNNDSLVHAFRKINLGTELKGLEELKDLMKNERDRELDRVEKMTLGEGLLELEKKGNSLEMQYELIVRKTSGFEEYLVDMFFSPRCAKCQLDELKANNCQEGSTFCVYDEEFLKFQLEYARKIVEKIKKGETDIEELKVPEKYTIMKNELESAVKST